MDWLEDDWIDWQKIVDYICKETELVEEIDLLKGNEQSQDVLSWFLRCVCTAAKAEYHKDAILIKRSETFTRLYRDSIPKVIGFQLSEQSWEWMFGSQKETPDCPKPRRTVYSDEGVIVCLALLTDLSVIMLHSLEENCNPERAVNTISVVRTLASALDKRTLFQRHHADRDLPGYIKYNPHTFTKLFTRPKSPLQDDDNFEEAICSKQPSKTSTMVTDELYYKPCKCRVCEPPETYRWITILLEYFGNNVVCDINGFQELVKILSSVKQPEKLKLEVVEVVLHFVSMALEYLKDEIASSFFDPCVDILRFISMADNCKYIVHSLGAVSMIFRHLRSIFKCFLQPKVAERMVEEGQKSMQEQLLAAFSGNVEPLKQLSFYVRRSSSEVRIFSAACVVGLSASVLCTSLEFSTCCLTMQFSYAIPVKRVLLPTNTFRNFPAAF